MTDTPGIDLSNCVLFSLRTHSETTHLHGLTEKVESMESNRFMKSREFQNASGNSSNVCCTLDPNALVQARHYNVQLR